MDTVKWCCTKCGKVAHGHSLPEKWNTLLLRIHDDEIEERHFCSWECFADFTQKSIHILKKDRIQQVETMDGVQQEILERLDRMEMLIQDLQKRQESLEYLIQVIGSDLELLIQRAAHEEVRRIQQKQKIDSVIPIQRADKQRNQNKHWDQKKKIGSRIRWLRKKKGLSQRDLAERLQFSSSTISLYETGVHIPNSENLEKIANFFGVTTDFILYGVTTIAQGDGS